MTFNIQAIVFDFGGVLLDWNPRNVYHRFFPGDPASMEQFLAEVNFMEWNALQDKGRSFAEGVAILSAQYPHHSHLIRAFHENWKESVTGEIPGTVEILTRLKEKGYPLYGLSNWSRETFPLMRSQYAFFELLDDMVISGYVNLIKPNPAIFHLLLQKIGKPANECLLIDDSDKNISVANQLGFATIHFSSPVQLEAELAHLGILQTNG
jgi:2-haloacid dehalogenase